MPFKKTLDGLPYKEYISQLFKKDEDCFEYFKNAARQKGINIFAVEAAPMGETIFANNPYMCIYVSTEQDYNEYEVDHGTRQMVNDRVKDILLPLWLDTCEKFSLDAELFHKPGMPMGLRRADFELYSYFARMHKDDVKEIIIQQIGCVPRYIFASYNAHINLVFEEEDYNKRKIDEKKTAVTVAILNRASAVVQEMISDTPPENILRVFFYHRGMENINLYGMSRED